MIVRWLTLGLGQVGHEVIGEPAVAGPEGLRLGGLGVPHDAEPVLVGVDALLEFSSSQGWSTPRESGSFCLNPVAAETVERVCAARFSAANSLDTFDYTAIPSVNKQLVMQLSRCEYVQRRENVIAGGDSGACKTHVSLGGPRRLPARDAGGLHRRRLGPRADGGPG